MSPETITPYQPTQALFKPRYLSIILAIPIAKTIVNLNQQENDMTIGTELIFLCESIVNNADTVTIWRHSVTNEFVVTYGEQREAFVDSDDALDRYMDRLGHAMQVGEVFE